ncbi:MAG: protein-disulfide reductase DsbD domain-containing protein [Verrucomicrobiota bacterium]
MKLFCISFLFAWLATQAFGAVGEQVRDGQVAAQIVTPFSEVAPGQEITIGVRYDLDEKWHTYWRNSGDTGLPIYIEWMLPDGVEAGELEWPYPVTYRNAHLVDYVYFDTVTLYTTLTIPENWEVGRVFPVEVETDWLMCEEICIPGKASLSLSIPVGSESIVDPAEKEAYEDTVERWPAPADEVSAEVRHSGDRIQVVVTGVDVADEEIEGLQLYPVDPFIAPGGAFSWFLDDNRLVGNFEKSPYASAIPETAELVMVKESGWEELDGLKALSVLAVASEDRILATGTTGSTGGGSGLGGLLLVAFVGGAILNLMPCVFPVLGLKIMGFVEKAGSDRNKIVGHGLLFTVGVLVSFWVLAGVLIGLRASGAELGWGFQLQSPVFVFGMAAFLLLFALNLSGVFEVGFKIAAAGARAEKGEGPLGSFFSGVLATVVATPCSAPFLATALAGALTLPALESFLTFTFIALGLAAPYLVLSLFPSLLKKLPKPGAWMESFKQLMAFPLYATVGWLIYVLAGQVEGSVFLRILLSFTVLALAAWVYGRYGAPHKSATTKRVGWVVSLLLLAGAAAYGYPRESKIEWLTWSPEKIEALREEERIIYVDFTARWCATCQVNKAVVFSSSEVLNFIADNNVALVTADWTNEDPAITRRLAELGKAAVPVNVVYLPGETEPAVLPETLTPGIVLSALEGD